MADAACLPDVDFADNMKNKPGIPTVKREKEAYKSLTRHVVMVRVGLNIAMAHACRQCHNQAPWALALTATRHRSFMNIMQMMVLLCYSCSL